MYRPAALPLALCAVLVTLGGCKDTKTSADASATTQQVQLTTDEQRMGYSLGATMGQQFRNDHVQVDVDALVQGMRDGYTNRLAVSEDELAAAMQQLQTSHAERMQAEFNDLATKNVSEGEAFLKENAGQDGVVTTASGLQYQVLTAGTGPKPTADDTVKVHYRGTLLDGTEFDSSLRRGEPVSFPVNAVIPGWVEALQLMPVGSKWKLTIPSDLAYGPGGAGSQIGPNAVLVFEVELLGIEPRETAAND